ncbi:MAG TPA: hypothetical protein VJ506_00910 [Candidatus Limnocylindrales bacterium]|nr:hypothetical protein [Candidatus Limnocylindrales bacterium]
MTTQTMTTAFARPRASLMAVLLAAVFALGLGSGVVVSPALRQGFLSIGLGGGTVAADNSAQAHLAWLQSEHDSYGSSAAGITDQASWQAYHQFRLSEEGYAP